MTTLNEQILEALRQGPATTEQIADLVYPGLNHDGYDFYHAKVRCRVQLQKLRLKGMIVCHHDGYDYHNTKPVWSVL